MPSIARTTCGIRHSISTLVLTAAVSLGSSLAYCEDMRNIPIDISKLDGADPSGVSSSTVAIEQAIADSTSKYGHRPIYIPPGRYRLDRMITLKNGQIMQCAGRTETIILVDSATFDMSSLGVIRLGTSEPGATIRDCGISFVQPELTTAVFKGIISGDVLTVTEIVSGQINIGNMLSGKGVSNASQVSEQISGATGGIGTYRVSVKQAAASTTITAASRDKVIHYPPALYAVSAPRFIIERVRVSSAWSCLNATGNSGGAHIGFIECGAMSPEGAIVLDGSHDFINIERIHCWNFGFNSLISLSVWKDQQGRCLEIGRVDGLHIGILQSLYQNVHFSKLAGSGGIPHQIDAIGLDNNGANLIAESGRIQIGKLYSTKNYVQRDTPIKVYGAKISISDIDMGADGTPRCSIEVTDGGSISLLGGELQHLDKDSPAACVDSGTLRIQNVSTTLASNRIKAFFAQSGKSALILTGVTFSPANKATGVAVSYTTDSTNSLMSSNNLNGWAVSTPFRTSNGYYKIERGKENSSEVSLSISGNGERLIHNRKSRSYFIRDGDFIDETIDESFLLNSSSSEISDLTISSSAPSQLNRSTSTCELSEVGGVSYNHIPPYNVYRKNDTYHIIENKNGAPTRVLSAAAFGSIREGFQFRIRCRYRVR